MRIKINAKTVALATVVAGILDLSGAIIVYVFLLKSVTVVRLLQSIAAGIIGKTSYGGGVKTAAAGVLIHFFIAFCWALLYQFVYPLLNKPIPNDLLKGSVYGCFVWMFMNLVIVPYSQLHRAFVFDPAKFFMSIGLIICCIGVPIALITGARFKRPLQGWK